MNKELLVTLLRKDIQELDMITQGFMEMSAYPTAIILLAQRKTEDIQQYILQLSTIHHEASTTLVEELKKELHEQEAEVSVIEVLTVPQIQEVENQDFSIEIQELEETPINDELPIEISEFENQSSQPISVEQTDEVIEVISVEPEPQAEKTLHTATTRNESLSKADNTLGASLGNKKIEDIKQAISIGDRFRFQRELFRGNGEEMNKSLTYINQLATLEEAISFLNSKHGWTEENETAVDFFQLVRRKFL
jgi:hypothetical protein